MNEKGTFMWAVEQAEKGHEFTRPKWQESGASSIKMVSGILRWTNNDNMASNQVLVDLEKMKATDYFIVKKQQIPLRNKQYVIPAAQLGIRHPGTEFLYLEKDVKKALNEFLDRQNEFQFYTHIDRQKFRDNLK